RTFVLCRLMDKAEKKTEGRTDGLINEGEPIAADHENPTIADTIPDVYTLPEMTLESIFPTPPQTDEYDFPSLQYSPIFTDQEPFQDSTFTNICFGNENNITQFPFDTTEDEDNVDLFLNAILVDEDVVNTEERRDAFVNDSTFSQSLRQVYYESSETDVELASAQCGNIFSTTPACKHAVSSRFQVMRMVDTPQDAVYAGPLSLSSKIEVKQEKKESIFGDNFSGMDISGDSTANKPLCMSVIENISSPSPPTTSFSSSSRRSKTKYHPRSDNSVARRTAPKSQTQRKVSSKATSQHEHGIDKAFLPLMYYAGAEGNTNARVKQRSEKSSGCQIKKEIGNYEQSISQCHWKRVFIADSHYMGYGVICQGALDGFVYVSN
ncbi:NAC domain-containing protein 69, partial [Sesbania bispinosa]